MNFFRRSKRQLSYVLMCLLTICSVFIVGCSNSQQTPESPTFTSEEATKQYSYAVYLGLDKSTFEDLLTMKVDDNEYKLIPASNNSKYREYWTSLVTKDENYVKLFFQNRQGVNREQAISKFNNYIGAMWNFQGVPDELFFITAVNGKFAGIIMCSGITSEDTVTIGYITAKEYAGQGIATNSLKIMVKLIKHLNSTKFCHASAASVWIFDDNPASIAVANNNGFVYQEHDSENNKSRYSTSILE